MQLIEAVAAVEPGRRVAVVLATDTGRAHEQNNTTISNWQNNLGVCFPSFSNLLFHVLAYRWVGEIEQSGLPLEKGRAYRGYVWATSGMLSRDDSTTGQNGTSSSPAHFGAAGTSSETNDGVALVLEVSVLRSRCVVRTKRIEDAGKVLRHYYFHFFGQHLRLPYYISSLALLPYFVNEHYRCGCGTRISPLRKTYSSPESPTARFSQARTAPLLTPLVAHRKKKEMKKQAAMKAQPTYMAKGTGVRE